MRHSLSLPAKTGSLSVPVKSGRLIVEVDGNAVVVSNKDANDISVTIEAQDETVIVEAALTSGGRWRAARLKVRHSDHFGIMGRGRYRSTTTIEVPPTVFVRLHAEGNLRACGPFRYADLEAVSNVEAEDVSRGFLSSWRGNVHAERIRERVGLGADRGTVSGTAMLLTGLTPFRDEKSWVTVDVGAGKISRSRRHPA
ncbi:hypothetical protein ACIBI3_38625 [Actinomadura luteofluorescens]|uniref:hypothetical protein n=1 Tax=Actinomadura luteofluorescens TaxID=46163 RepID=UPI00347BAFB6